MPRSGSTLLQNIIGNRPDFYVTPTSGLFDLIHASKKTYTQSPNIKAQNSQTMKDAYMGFCHFALHGYFAYITDKKYILDKSRGWISNLPFLDSFYKNAKIICMVRDLRDILASMEKNYQKYPEKFDYQLHELTPTISVQGRIKVWSAINPVGTMLERMKEIIRRNLHDKIHFIKYEDLCKNPQTVMEGVHSYLEIDSYDYDFSNIQQVTDEDDKWHGKYGDHKIRNVIQPVESRANLLLGEYVCDRIYEENTWYFDFFKYSK